MKEIEEKILRAVQDGIPLVQEPFRGAAESVGVSEEEFLNRLRAMKTSGTIRRFGVKIDQRKMGIVANAVAMWKIPEDKLEETIKILVHYPQLTHCYERRTYPGRWEYNLYTVIHGYSEDSVRDLVESMAETVGIRDYQISFSKRKFKGTSSRLSKEEATT